MRSRRFSSRSIASLNRSRRTSPSASAASIFSTSSLVTGAATYCRGPGMPQRIISICRSPSAAHDRRHAVGEDCGQGRQVVDEIAPNREELAHRILRAGHGVEVTHRDLQIHPRYSYINPQYLALCCRIKTIACGRDSGPDLSLACKSASKSPQSPNCGLSLETVNRMHPAVPPKGPMYYTWVKPDGKANSVATHRTRSRCLMIRRTP